MTEKKAYDLALIKDNTESSEQDNTESATMSEAAPTTANNVLLATLVHPLQKSMLTVGIATRQDDKNAASEKKNEIDKENENNPSTDEDNKVAMVVNEIVYDNKLLNHPNLLKEPLKEFSLSQILNLSTSLDQDLLSEAIAINDSSLILGGLISLSGNNSNDSSYD